MTPRDRATPPDPEPQGLDLRLRREAEARVARFLQAEGEDKSPEIRRLIHELSVHQIELEMQNEQLRQTQLELEAARARYYDLYQEAPVAYLTVGPKSRILECNRKAAELLQVPPQRLTRRQLTEFMHPKEIQTFATRHERLLVTGAVEACVVPMRRAGGTYFWAQLLMNLTREEEAQPPVTRIALTDLTDRMRNEERAARLAAIVTSSDLAIISQNPAGDVTSWNAGAERLFGYAASEMTGGDLSLLFPPDRVTEESETRSRVGQGDTVAQESVRLRQDGTPVSVFVTSSPLRDEEGHVTGISHILRDIGEQVAARDSMSRLLDDLRESEQALREADRRKDEFIATLAHELRNPLAPIRNAAAVLRYAPSLDPKVEWCRDVIDRQVGQMAALLDDLLDVSRITRNLITLRRDRVELSTAIAQAVETTRPLIDARGHELTVQLPQHPIEVEGDLTRLTQIFGNLLNNAAKYTDPKGWIAITGELQGAEVEIRVKDSGIGIDPAQLPQIFELFSQIDTTMERAQGGLGIGLSLVKGLVEKHGGTIEALSEGPGRGSEFVVRLPVVRSSRPHDPAARGVEEGSEARWAGATGRRVLVVDDNADAADSLALMLTLNGYDVRTAQDGESALELAAEYRPNVVFLDVGLPRLNGYEVARRLRDQPWGRDMLLVACTGWGQGTDRRRSSEAGFDHHVVKPVDPKALMQLMSAGPPTDPDHS